MRLRKIPHNNNTHPAVFFLNRSKHNNSISKDLGTLWQFGRRLKRFLRRSVGKQAAELNLGRTTVRRILHKDLYFQTDKIRIVRELKPVYMGNLKPTWHGLSSEKKMMEKIDENKKSANAKKCSEWFVELLVVFFETWTRLLEILNPSFNFVAWCNLDVSNCNDVEIHNNKRTQQ